MGPLTNAIYKAINPKGVLVHEGFQVKCRGLMAPNPDLATDPTVEPEILIRHVIATLDDHLPGAQAHAWNNEEFTDDLWIIDPSQTSIDWTNPTCRICGQGIAS